MQNNTREIEMYVGEGENGGTWYTMYIEIPADTLDENIDEVAIGVAEKSLYENGIEAAFVGVYSVPPEDDSDDDEFDA